MPTSSDIAVFPSSDSPVLPDIEQDTSVGGISIDNSEGTYAITGDGNAILTIGGAGIVGGVYDPQTVITPEVDWHTAQTWSAPVNVYTAHGYSGDLAITNQVTIGQDGSGQLTIDTSASITNEADLEISSGAYVEISGGSLTNDHDLEIDSDASLNIDGGSLQNNGLITINSSASVESNQPGDFTGSGSIYNGGTVAVGWAGGNPTFVNSCQGDYGTYQFDGNGTINLQGDCLGGSVEIGPHTTALINTDQNLMYGTLTVDAGGELDISGGYFGLGQNATIRGTINLTNGSTLDVGYTNTGSGQINVSDSTLEMWSSEYDEDITINDGGVMLVDSSSYVNCTATTNINNGGTLDIESDAYLSIISGSTFTDQGTIDINSGATLDDQSTFIINSGTVDVTGTLSIDSGATLSLSNTSNLVEDDTGDIEVVGTLNIANGSAFTSNGGLLSDYGTLTVDASTLNLNSDSSLDVASDGNLTFSDGAVFDITEGAFSNFGSVLIDASTGVVSSGSVTLSSGSVFTVRDSGQVTFNGCSFSAVGALNIALGGSVIMEAGLYPAGVNINAGGVLTIAAGGSLSSGTVTISPGGTLVNNSTLNLSTALSSGNLILDTGSTLINQGTLAVAGSLTLGTVDLQNQGTLDLGTSGSISGGGTYTVTSSFPFTYSIQGGTVSGIVTQTGSDTYSYQYTPTSQSYTDTNTDASTFSDSGSQSYPGANGMDSGTLSDQGHSTYSETTFMSAALQNGVWVYSGSDSGSSSDQGNSSFTKHGTYVAFVDLFKITGTTDDSGGSNWADTSSWDLTLQSDGNWTINSDNNDSSQGGHSTFSYTGGGNYTRSKLGTTFTSSFSEAGSNTEANNAAGSDNFNNGTWVSNGSSSGTWNDAGHWTQDASASFSVSTPDESVDAMGAEHTGENWTSQGTSGYTLGTNGVWSLTSGTNTDTDHNFDNGNSDFDASASSATFDASLSATDTFGYSDNSTLNGHVTGGAWIYTGSGSTQSSDSGDELSQDNESYTRISLLGDVLYSVPISGSATETGHADYSSSFNTASTMAASGNVTTTGSGNSHEFSSDNFSFAGGSEASAPFTGLSFTLLTGYIAGDGIETGDSTESGMQNVTSDITTSWVLDPSGSWRAASQQDIETGETKVNYKFVCAVTDSTTDDEGNVTKSRFKSTDQWQTDFSYNDNINTAITSNGDVTHSGTGSGTGSENGNRNSQKASPADNWVISGSFTYNDNWTQDYSQNTANLTSGYLYSGTYWDAESGTYITATDSTGAGIVLYDAPCTGAMSDALPQTGATFDTSGNPAYGIILSPGMKVMVSSMTAVRNYGTAVPSDPDSDYTPPKWESTAVWTFRGVAVASGIGAIGLEVAGLVGGAGVARSRWSRNNISNRACRSPPCRDRSIF